MGTTKKIPTQTKRRDMSKAEYLSLQNVYDIYGFNPKTLRRDLWEQKAGNLKKDSKRGIAIHVPHYKIGGQWLFKRTDIDEFLEGQKVEAFCNSETNGDD